MLAAHRPSDNKRRLNCLLYEAVLLLTLSFIPTVLFFWLQGILGPSYWLIKVLQISLFLIISCYFVSSWVHGGQTVAMKVWDVQLSRADGLPLGWGGALRRWLIVLTLVIGIPLMVYGLIGHQDVLAARLALFCCLLTFLWRYIDPQQQYLHDRLAGTRLSTLPQTEASGFKTDI